MTPDQFKEARLKLGLSGAQLAEMLSVTPQQVTNYENGNRVVKGPALRLIQAFIAGYRPKDWPKEGRANKSGRPMAES